MRVLGAEHALEASLDLVGTRRRVGLRLLPREVAELLRRVWVAAGEREDLGDGLRVDRLPGRSEASGDVVGELGRLDHVQLHLLGATPERLVRVVEDPRQHVALAAEIDVRDLGLGLEDAPHQLRQGWIDLDDLLELVEDQRDRPLALGGDLPGQLQQALERRIDVGPRVAGGEREAERAVGGVDRDRRRDPQPAEEGRSAITGPLEARQQVAVDRARELLRELLLRRRRHQVDGCDQDALGEEVLLRAPDERRLPIAPGGEDHDVLAVADVLLELAQLGVAIGERLVERQCAVAKRVGLGRGRHYTLWYYTAQYEMSLLAASGIESIPVGIIPCGILLSEHLFPSDAPG